MNKHVFLPITLLLLFLSLNTFGQRSDKRVYTDSGWWTLGITGGVAWQNSDIRAIPGWGVGVDLAKNIYHRPQGLLDLDLRGRLLYTNTYGADHERSFGILDNDALNGTNDPDLNYTAPTGPGFTFMNHKTYLGEASLEAVLTANRLRENTGIILQGFGGLGLNGYQTFTDQLAGSEMYDWSEIDTDRRRLDILSQIGTYGYYETPAQDYDNAPRISVMPSLGLGLGYQLSRNFSIGLEHKTNWALHDNLEGQQFNRENNELTDDNDIHHYTSLYLRWRIGDRYKQEPTPTVNSVIDCNGTAPIITFKSPRKEISTTDSDCISVAANIEYLDGRENITVRFNGKPLNTYTFDTRKDKFTKMLELEPGNNTLEIIATNKCGERIDSRTIIYEPKPINSITSSSPKPSSPKPTVRITRPAANPYNSAEQIVSLKADVENVDKKSDIIFEINGKRTYNFDFGGYLGGTITADIPLETEKTDVSIEVRNANGRNRDTQRIIYKGNTNYNLPNVRISSPSGSSYNSTENTVPVIAKIENVNSKNDITFTVNGQRTSNFVFNAASDEFRANVALAGERTEVIIHAVNNYGNDSDDVSIIYCPPAAFRPQVTIIKPMNGQTTLNDREDVTATVTNVNSRADINVKINNRPILNFNYNNSRNELTFTANLDAGSNTIHIKATNSAGSDSDNVTINYNAIERPEVDIIKPNSDPYTSSNSSAGIVAVVQNVDSKNDITFKVNGRATRSFTYSALSGKVTANVSLVNGNNTVYIKATNSAGSDSDDMVIKYNKPPRTTNTPQLTPIVKITQPNTSPFTVNSQQVAILATISNVPSSRDITFTVNGRKIRGFDYQPDRNTFEGLITLHEGENNIVITGRNGSKTASDNTIIIYEERTQTNGQFGDTFNDNTDNDSDNNDGGGKITNDEDTKPSRPILGNLIKGKRTKKSTRSSGGN